MQTLVHHNASKMHKTQASGAKKYTCGCGKYYMHQQSLRNHKQTCTDKQQGSTVDQLIIKFKQDIDSQKLEFIKEREEQKQAFDKERQQMKFAIDQIKEDMKDQINKILEKHAVTNNIESQQNITININAFGNENTDYIDEKSIIACIGRVYNSIPTLLEKIHFDPKHPENHNIKITNRKLPYASVMGLNKKWKTVDRKDAIDSMVTNSYNLLDEKYTETKDKISSARQKHFEGFQSKFEAEDKEVMRQIKTDVDVMVLNGVTP